MLLLKQLKDAVSSARSLQVTRYYVSIPFLDKGANVIRSTSHCPYENLALEDYLYETVDFSDGRRLLYLWANRPCIVVGRHQNPWKEVNLRLQRSKDVLLCRRKSGGGTVYHDLGNLNLTFFTSRNNYNRKHNLDFIIKALKQHYCLDISYNERDDILLDNEFKVSGTAAKLGLRTAYHHCTLLCDTNLNAMSGLLRSPFGGSISTKATSSVSSVTENLFPGNYNLKTITDVIGQEFCNELPNDFKVIDINPLDISGINKHIEELKSWEWVFGKTPKFQLSNIWDYNGLNVQIELEVVKGVIRDAALTIDDIVVNSPFLKDLIGEYYCVETIDKVERNCSGFSIDFENLMLEWIFKG